MAFARKCHSATSICLLAARRTKAATMPNQLSQRQTCAQPPVAHAGRPAAADSLTRALGQTFEVLVEGT